MTNVTYTHEGGKLSLNSKKGPKMKPASSVLTFAVLGGLIILILSACTNPFMEKILGRRPKSENEIDLYTGPYGSGSDSDPWRVYDVATLKKVGTETAAGGWTTAAHYRQVRNINMTGQAWAPIGAITSSDFTGSYDGGGNTITGLTITSGLTYSGMFSTIGNAPYTIVKNVNLANIHINVSPDIVGGITGKNFGTIKNCHVSGRITGTDNTYVGAIAGINDDGSVIDCTSNVNIELTSSTQDIGGIVGLQFGSSDPEVVNCHSHGMITAANSVNIGGVVGQLVKGEVLYSSSTGTISGERMVGGVTGLNTGIVEFCYATGVVSGVEDVGGVVGHNNGGLIRNNYARAVVLGGNHAGGVVGNNINGGTIEYCYAAGDVSGDDYIGGIAGELTNGKIESCVALNQNIFTSLSAGDFGRIAGRSALSVIINSYARRYMEKDLNPHSWAEPWPSGLDGQDIEESDWQDKDWWLGTAFFADIWWDDKFPLTLP